MIKIEVKLHIIFHPNWYHRNFGISFEEDFFFDYSTRILTEKIMKKGLYEKFGDFGIGVKDPVDEPIIGSYNIAAGWFLESVLGCELIFTSDNSPQVLSRNISDSEINEMEVPIFPNEDNYYFQKIKKIMDKMEEKFGYLKGDINLQGVQNIAFQVRGQELFIDYYQNPGAIKILLNKITDTIINAAKYFKHRTGSNSLAASPTILAFNDKSIFVTSNCTVDMVSIDTYRKSLMEYDETLSKTLVPFGIHHCGKRADEFSEVYKNIENISYFEAGWESDVEVVRNNFPNCFLSLRLSPARLNNQTNDELIEDIVKIVKKGKPLDKIVISSYGVDSKVPDEKIRLLYSICNNIEDYL